MTLRAQIALLVASVVTVVVAVVGVGVHRSAEAELVEEVDLELLQRGSAVPGAGRGGRGFTAPDEQSDFQREVSGVTFVRLLSQEGGLVLFRLATSSTRRRRRHFSKPRTSTRQSPPA